MGDNYTVNIAAASAAEAVKYLEPNKVTHLSDQGEVIVLINGVQQ